MSASHSARLFGWVWIDPAAGLLGAIVIATWAYTLIRDTGAILLDMTPDRGMAERMRGKQAQLAKLLQAVDVRAVGPDDGRAVGVLLAEAGTNDAIDATVALLAGPGDRILTSDPEDLARLVSAAGSRSLVVRC